MMEKFSPEGVPLRYLFADLESLREHFKSHTFSLFKGTVA
jgi:hypothetical protein